MFNASDKRMAASAVMPCFPLMMVFTRWIGTPMRTSSTWVMPRGLNSPSTLGLVAFVSVTYVKAGLIALLASLVLGVVTGAWFLVVRAVGSLRPEDKAAVLAQSIAEAMNCAAFYATLMIPLSLIVAYVVRRRRRRPKSEPS